MHGGKSSAISSISASGGGNQKERASGGGNGRMPVAVKRDGPAAVNVKSPPYQHRPLLAKLI